MIDGTEAGAGTPYVQLTGVKANIDVQTTSLGGESYHVSVLKFIRFIKLLTA